MKTIYIYGDIVSEDVSDWWPDAVAPKQVADELAQSKGEEVLVRFNSVGGSADAGIAISNLLKEHDAPVTGRVDGLAASAATIILMGCGSCEMADNSALMIHSASYFTLGQFNATDMRQMAEQLDNYDTRIANTYAKRANDMSPSDFLEMMTTDTYITAQAAKDMGLIDLITDESDAEVHVKQTVANKLHMDRVPDGVAARLVIDPPKAKQLNQPPKPKKTMADHVEDAKNKRAAVKRGAALQLRKLKMSS